MKRTIIALVILVAVIAVGFALYRRSTSQPGDAYTDVAPATDSIEAIEQELKKIDRGDSLEVDFQKTEEDLRKL